ncbi:hypothetical protein V496_10483 [Pseudogymnoascus sp. VKM F-4515 (FW-2607)]|nr:hypothetical protein V496_10483 [Pseudogymnoascus sp. VKM F-4515 (FW-2607)]
MAEPLGIAASIIALLTISKEVIEYSNSIKDGKKDRQRLLDEITSVTGFLYVLKDRAEQLQHGDSWSETLVLLAGPTGPLEQFKSALERVASKLAPAVGWRKAGKAMIWPFRKEEISDILAEIERHKSIFSLALHNDHIQLSQVIQDGVRSLNDKADELVEGVARLQSSQQSHDEQIILNWLTPLEFPLQFSDFMSRCQTGTGQWLLESDEFKTWIDNTGQILYCPGIPGSGKTMLTSIVIDHLSKSAQDENVGIAYIYCNYQNQLEQTPVNMFASILKQLVQTRPSISNDVKNLYEGQRRRKNSRPMLNEILAVLHSEISRYAQVYILVDGLDEYANHGTRKQLLDSIWELYATGVVNLMVTSRFIPKIQQEFQSALQLEIRASDEDVQKYLVGQMHLLPACVTRNLLLQEKVISDIIDTIDGMFLLAQLHLDSLTDKVTPKAVKTALSRLPKGSTGLDMAYDQAMERITNQKPGFRELAEQILSWITYAQRPMSVRELQHALAVELGKPKLDEDNLSDIEELVSVCAGLVIVDQESDTVRLVHYTTQEYFERIRLNRFPGAQENISKSCLTYLLFDAFEEARCPSDEELKTRLQHYALLDYAAGHWGSHAHDNVELGVKSLALEFLTSDSNMSCSVQVIENAGRNLPGYGHRNSESVSGVHVCAYFDLEETAVGLLELNIKPDTEDSNGRTPLSWAAERGHEAFASFLLLRANVKVDSKDSKGRTPLSWAAENGQEAVVRMLIERKDVDADSKDSSGQTPLSWAAVQGHEFVVRQLLECEDVVPDSRDDRNRSPLSLAATRGSEALMMLFLERDDVDPDSKNDRGQTPLSLASSRGDGNVVRLLLSRDDISAESRDIAGRTPLSWAALEGHEEVARQLLEQEGVKADSRDDNECTPLSLAVGRGQYAVAKLLLEQEDVEADSKDGNGRTPLSLAAARGWEDLVKLLLTREDVDADSKDKWGMTPLSWAAVIGNIGVVGQLLARDDIKVDIEDIFGRTPLFVATTQGHEDVIKLLTERMPEGEKILQTVVGMYTDRAEAVAGAAINAGPYTGDLSFMRLKDGAVEVGMVPEGLFDLLPELSEKLESSLQNTADELYAAGFSGVAPVEAREDAVLLLLAAAEYFPYEQGS